MKDQNIRERWGRLTRLLDPIHERALATARNLCRSPDDGDDLYQESVLRAYRKLHTLREETRFRSWFFAVLLSVHRSRCRRAFWKRFLPLEDATSGGREPVGEDGRPKHEEIQSARRVARALSRLPAVQREALVLHEIEGFSMEEIAAMQDVTVSAVKSRVLRGRNGSAGTTGPSGSGSPLPPPALGRAVRDGDPPGARSPLPRRSRRFSPPSPTAYLDREGVMSDVRGTGKGRQDTNPRSLDDRVDRDLEAMAERSRQNMGSLTEIVHDLSGMRPGRSWEDTLMAFLKFFSGRPRLATATAVAVVAAALLLVPVSYQRTVGHEVALELSGAGLDRDVVHEIAGEFQTVLGAESLNLDVRGGASGTVYTVSSTVPAGEGGDVRAVSEAFARSLSAKGYTAEAAVTPIRETVSGNVYAMVMNNVIRVSVDGKNAEELEAEITEKLAAAGVPNAQVSVTMEDGDHMEIQVQAEVEGGEGEIGEAPTLVLTANGQDLGGEMAEEAVRIMKTVDENGEHLVVEVEPDGETATATVDNPDGLSDAALAAEIHRQLTEQGLGDLSVSAENGMIRCLSADDLPAPAPSDEERTSWGKLKKAYETSN